MKKYICRGLMYQWFNSAKSIIFLGLIAWGFISYTFIGQGIEQMSWRIASNYSNYYYTSDLYDYSLLFIIFVIIHFAGQGLSKRNNLMFLNSSPYTKKQIKYNEILCLILTGAIFITVFVYMACIRYVNYRNLMSIVEGYFLVIGIEVLRMVLIGIISVLFIMIIDSMFSNSIIGLIAMMSAIPFSLFVILCKLNRILEYVAVKDGKNIYSLMRKASDEEYRRVFVNPLIDTVSINEIHVSNMLISVLITVAIIFVLFIVYNKMQKLNSLEYGTRIFSSKINEKIIRVLCSVGAGCFVGMVFVLRYTDELIGARRGMYEALTGVNLIKALSADILCITIVAFVCNFILKKILKIFE